LLTLKTSACSRVVWISVYGGESGRIIRAVTCIHSGFLNGVWDNTISMQRTEDKCVETGTTHCYLSSLSATKINSVRLNYGTSINGETGMTENKEILIILKLI
jgi:hypothetical protein